MRHPLTQSLIFPAGILMAGIVMLALTSMVGSIVIAETARGDAAAINLAGSLRMQSYRMANALHVDGAEQTLRNGYLDKFEQTLRSDVLTRPLPEDAAHPLRSAYEQVRERWESQMRPTLERAQLDREGARADFLPAVDAFVADVEHVVQLLQRDAEAKIQVLRLIQGVALFLTLTLVFIGMYKLLTDLMPPLRDLLRVANQARTGDFSARTTYRGNDELGLLSHSFNLMAEDLSRMYGELEKRVEDKTAALSRSNQALRLLYQTTRTLNRDPSEHQDYGSILGPMEQLFGNASITLCLSTAETEQAYQRVTGRHRPQPLFCQAPNCAPCFAGELPVRAGCHVRQVPIRDAGQQYGVLLLQYEPGKHPELWQLELVETVAGHIAAALSLRQQTEQQRRLALMDERAVIARELHDSLAQALSYLKIQVSRLQVLIQREAAQAEKQGVIDELREGLNAAYRQLRELLSTFRLKMNEAGLEPALQSTITEFAERGGLDIVLDYQLAHCPLSPNEEIHMLQVIREALANIVHHAKATHAEVCLFVGDDGEVVARIRDNGVGLPDNWQRSNHYGMSIMHERSESLGGALDVQRRAEGGTEVRLHFPPQVTRRGAGSGLLSSSSTAP